MKNGISADIFDSDIQDIESFCADATVKYDLIGISGTHFSIGHCFRFVKYVLDHQDGYGYLVAGGVSATYDYPIWLNSGFHAVILGYGERPLLELCKALSADTASERAKLIGSINGIAYKSDETIIVNPSQPVTSQQFRELNYFNELELEIPYHKYWSINSEYSASLARNNFYFNNRTVYVYTSSNCPNRCGYCNGKFLDVSQEKLQKIQYLDANDIVDIVVDKFKKYKPKLIYFADDDFFFSKLRIKEFCNKILLAKSNGTLDPDLDFGCQSRVVNFISNGEADVEFIQLLQSTGFKPISIGAESCSSKLLCTPLMNKPGYGKTQVFKVAQAMLQNGIFTGVNFMLMLPDANREDTLFDLNCAYELLEMGVEIRATVRVMAQSGAPAIHNSDYPVYYTEFTSPLNGNKIQLSQYFLPKDNYMSEIFVKYEEQLQHEERILTERFNLQDRKRNSFYAIGRCMALSKALGDVKTYQRFEHAAELWFGNQ